MMHTFRAVTAVARVGFASAAATTARARSMATAADIKEWFNFSGKVAMVTGAATGIGKAVALSYAAAGAKVVVADFDTKLGPVTVEEIKKAGGDALFVKCDVSKEEEVQAAVKSAVAKFGRLDIAFNNAGIVAGAGGPIDTTPTSDWAKTLSVNLNGVFYCIKHQAPEMKKVGGGAIVNTASIAGVGGGAGMSAYVASKHAVVGLTKCAAMDLAEHKIRVNALCPGYVITPILTAAGLTDETLKAIAPTVNPMKRLAQPDEMVGQVLLLSSNKATPYQTGTTVISDGGQTCHF